MPINDEELNKLEELEKQKTEERAKAEAKEVEEAKKRKESFENEIIAVLRTKKGEQKQWFTFQEIEVQVLGRKLSTYTKEIYGAKVHLLNTLDSLVKEGKIEKKVVGMTPYYSTV